MRLAARSEFDFDMHEQFKGLGVLPGQTHRAGDEQRILRALENHVARAAKKPVRLHPDLLFEKVAAGLGRVELLKREDEGVVLSRAGRDQAPDFRLSLPDKKQLLVEVVSAARIAKAVRVDQRRLERLTRYAATTATPLRFAIFWRDASFWTLVPAAAFRAGVLECSTAGLWNDMVQLGDYQLGTVHPLSIQLISVPDGRGRRKIASLEMSAAGVRLESARERDIALFLMVFGDWHPQFDVPSRIPQEGELHAKVTLTPRLRANAGERFEMVGPASTLLSRYFSAIAANDEIARTVVPPDFSELVEAPSERLPLWRFQMSPKYADSVADVTSRLDDLYSREPSGIPAEFELASSEAAGVEDW